MGKCSNCDWLRFKLDEANRSLDAAIQELALSHKQHAETIMDSKATSEKLNRRLRRLFEDNM